MLPDNAAIVPLPEPVDEFDAMTDRELALYNARTLRSVIDTVNGIQAQVAPAMEKLQSNPLLGALFRK